MPKILTDDILRSVKGSERERLRAVLVALGQLEQTVRHSNGQHSRIERRWLVERLRAIRVQGELPKTKGGAPITKAASAESIV